MEGLKLFHGALSISEQEELTEAVEGLAEVGRVGGLKAKTYSAITYPSSFGKQQSREVLQFGAYVNQNRVENCATLEIPELFVRLIDKLEQEGIFTAEERPDTCCVNILKEEQWLPPRVDSKRFERPIFTISLLSEQAIIFGSSGLESVAPGQFEVTNAERVMLPVGSLLRIDGHAANVAKRAIPSAPARRILLTFRRLSIETRRIFEADMNQRRLGKESRKERKRQGKLERKAARTTSAKASGLKGECKSIVTAGSMKSVQVPSELLTDQGRYDPVTADPRVTPVVELEHVKRLYNTIAEHWHGTRYKPWPRVAEFIEKQPKGALIGDIGCGNGKNIPACNQVGVGIGCDLSSELVKISVSMGAEAHVADALALPYRDNVFDTVLSIAVLHHISSVPRRLQLLKEAMRVVAVGGEALFYAWAFEQENAKSGHKFAAQDVLVPWHFKVQPKKEKQVTQLNPKAEVFEPASSSGDFSYGIESSNSVSDSEGKCIAMHNECTRKPTQSSLQDTEATITCSNLHGSVEPATHGTFDEAKGTVVYQRYCHVYMKGELEGLLCQIPWIEVADTSYDSGNWLVIVRKLWAPT